MLRVFLIILGIGALIYLGLCAALFFFQRSLIYFPQPSADDRPGGTIQLPVAGASLVVSVLPRTGNKALIYFGGNAEDVSQNLPSFAAAFPTHSLYLMHYRGYGGSTGTPSEAALKQDALALFDKVHAEHPDIALIGRSLGTGVAIHLASQRPATRLILVTPYNSIAEIAAAHFPWIPVKWFLLDKYESWRYAPQIRIPTLLLAAEYDEVIPAISTEMLYTHFSPGIASMIVIPGVMHNTISASPEYLELMRAALQ